MSEVKWFVFHNTRAVVKRHILFINDYLDLLLAPMKCLESIEFVVTSRRVHNNFVNKMYTMKVLYSRDEMREFRFRFKLKFDIAYLGHLFVLHSRPVPYNLLNEWLVFNVTEVKSVSSIVFEPPHVIVFDMDSTLITEEKIVRIRDSAIYDGLAKLRDRNCVLCLWSYGDRQHVIDSLQRLDLMHYFTIILSEGNVQGVYEQNESVDPMYNTYYTTTPFHLNVDTEDLPKSPRVVLWYLYKKGFNYIKTITLVDDLLYNDYNYDNFVHITRCPEPVNDWSVWYEEITNYLNRFDEQFHAR
ncbi:hypothetical protein SlGVgp077 [Spodoptera litura granulovirus]|uniref:38k n=1 Tax=Spodoptera litura granulovirus TaxID=359919 RepID=A5IZS9_9BBAC|nr:hypothetical protein SlGVgp077 [Spodoptera litura granulovirus]ABQ52020.1 hypothetical protein SlGVgp077 [Spodoptera litura granulovirus]